MHMKNHYAHDERALNTGYTLEQSRVNIIFYFRRKQNDIFSEILRP